MLTEASMVALAKPPVSPGSGCCCEIRFAALARRVAALSHASEPEPVIRLSRCAAVTVTVAAAAAAVTVTVAAVAAGH